MRSPAQRSTKSTQDSPQETVNEVMSDKELGERPAAEVMVVRAFKDDELRALDSWDAAMAAAVEEYGTVANVGDELGNGFAIASEEDQERLCGVPLLFLEWSIVDGDFGPYVSARVIQRLDDGGIKKWIINDGGQGINIQLQEYQERTGKTGGLGAKRGLRVSKYYIDPDTGQGLTKQEVREYIAAGRKTVPAHTFYIDTSA